MKSKPRSLFNYVLRLTYVSILPVVTSFILVSTIYANEAKDNTTQTSATPLLEAKDAG